MYTQIFSRGSVYVMHALIFSVECVNIKEHKKI